MAQEDEATAKAIDLFLSRNDPKGLAKSIRSQITGLKRRSRFVDYYESDSAARELHGVLDAIERDLIPADPVLALKALQKFIETDSNVMGNADDSNGVMADANHRACQLLGVASTAAGKPREAEEIFLALHDFHDYGTRDTMFDEAVNILSEEALQRIITQWRFRMQGEDFKKFGGIRVRLGQVAESMGDPVLHEEASLGGRPIEEYPLVALDVARVYLACGQPEIALTKIPSEEACRHPEERMQVLIDIQRALGNTAAVEAGEAGELGVVGDLAGLEEVVEDDGEGHQAGHARNGRGGLRLLGSFAVEQLSGAAASAGKVDFAFDGGAVHAGVSSGSMLRIPVGRNVMAISPDSPS